MCSYSLKVRKLSGSCLLGIPINVSTLCKRCILPILLRLLTFSTLNQAGNVESMGGAVGASFKWYDFVYFIDTIIYLIILIFKRNWLDTRAFSKKFVPVVMAASVALFFLNLAFAETDRPELLTRTFDHKYLVKYLGPYNFTVYDGVKTIQNNQQKALASEDDLTKVLNYTKQKRTEPNQEYYGVAKRKILLKYT